MKRVLVAGASGYTGSEVIRLVLAHSSLELAGAASSRSAGRRLDEVMPAFRGTTDLVLETFEPEGLADRGIDLVFMALPHCEGAALMGRVLASGVKVVDLSGDFRLRSAAVWARHYARPHPAPQLLDQFVYGITELERERIQGARAVANPGCFATAAILALAPAAAAGWVGEAIVDGKTGSSGAGASPSATTHHPERIGKLCAYGPLEHRHAPEIAQALAAVAPAEREEAAGPAIHFVPHSTPLVRGVYATCYVRGEIDERQAEGRYRSFYEAEQFVRLTGGPPDCRNVAGSNFADVAVAGTRGLLVAMCAIDNLVKGAAGQALQNANLMLGLPESEGLRGPGWRV